MRNAIMKKVAAIVLAIMVAGTFGMTTEDVSAAAKKPSKVKIVSAKASGQSTVVVKWKKAAGAKGYQIYQNGVAIKKVGAKTVSYKKTGLNPGTNYAYKVRAYTIYKQKQYYNKKTKKWQAKKPAKKYLGKSRNATKYKYGAFSSQKSARTAGYAYVGGGSSPGGSSGSSGGSTPGGGSGSGNTGNWIGYLSVPEDPNVTISYGSTTIHLGQVWTDAVFNALKAGASDGAYEKVTRVGNIQFYRYQTDPTYGFTTAEEYSAIQNTDIYMFDTNDYDNYLMVYVHGGKISRWITNRSNMGQSGAQALMRGATSAPSKGYRFFKDYFGYVSGAPEGGVVLGGFMQNMNSYSREPASYTVDIAGEKKIGRNLINAYRFLCGAGPLEYNVYLDGEQRTWSGSYYSYNYGQELVYTNTRYGAQAWAETMNASKKCAHSGDFSDGPLKGSGYVTNSSQRGQVIYSASDKTVYSSGENVGFGNKYGEHTLSVYESSVLHIDTINDSSFKKIGIGISGSYHCEQYAD